MSAVDKARARGHKMRVSPLPVATNVKRWDCLDCLAAAIEYDGNFYGLALEMDCPGSRAA